MLRDYQNCYIFALFLDYLYNKMLRRLKRLHSFYQSQRSLRLVVLAALLLQVILAVQHYYAHRLLEKDLERDAEREMILKALQA